MLDHEGLGAVKELGACWDGDRCPDRSAEVAKEGVAVAAEQGLKGGESGWKWRLPVMETDPEEAVQLAGPHLPGRWATGAG